MKSGNPYFRKYSILLLFIFLFIDQTSLFGQDSLQLVVEIPIQGDQFTTDNLGNCYVVTNNQINKYSPNGAFIQKFSDMQYGEIYSVDATDPNKILVFFRDFGNLVILDNTLSQNGSVFNMRFSQFDQPVVACRSFDNGFWIFDVLPNELHRLDRNFMAVHKTGNLTQAIGTQVRPNFAREHNNVLYLNNDGKGVLVFDQYGTFLKRIAIQTPFSFQVKDKHIYFPYNNSLGIYSMKDIELTYLALTDKEILDCRIEKDKLYVLTSKALKIYQFVRV